MKHLLIIVPVFAALAFAYDASVKQFARVSAVPVGDGGMVACTHTTNPYCAWNSNQTGTYEIYGCSGADSTGTFQCTGPIACLTCGKDATLFGYSRPAQKGQPWFEPTNNKQLTLWVGNSNYTSPRCAAPRPGNGICGDLWVININITPSGATLANPNPGCSASSPSNCLPNANITKIPNPDATGFESGVLFGRYGGGLLWISYRFGDKRPGACVLGAWMARAFHYTDDGGAFRIGPEVAAVANASKRMFPCNYLEMSGFYDAASGEFTFEAAPNRAHLWQNNIYAISPTGAIDTVIPWGAGPGSVSDCPWNEHANTDPAGKWIVWSSSHGATAGSYDGCVAPFNPNLPLDKWMAPLTHPAPGHLGTDLSRAVRLTGFNVSGSPDRTYICSVEGPCGTGPNARTFSGGYADLIGDGQGIQLIKHGVGNGTLFGFSIKVN
jgi:hypothetical protein